MKKISFLTFISLLSMSFIVVLSFKVYKSGNSGFYHNIQEAETSDPGQFIHWSLNEIEWRLNSAGSSDIDDFD